MTLIGIGSSVAFVGFVYFYDTLDNYPVCCLHKLSVRGSSDSSVIRDLTQRQRERRRRHQRTGREFAVVVGVVDHFVFTIYVLDFYGSGSTKMPNIRDVLVLAYDCKLLDDVEFVLLSDLNRPKNPQLPYWSFDNFDLDELCDDECQTNFRFYGNDIYNLTEVLELPELFKCYNGVVVDKVEAFCMFLKRFAYPGRYADLVPLFARPIPQLCMATNEVVNFIHARWSYLLSTLNQPWLSCANLQLFANAIHEKCAGLRSCWGL